MKSATKLGRVVPLRILPGTSFIMTVEPRGGTRVFSYSPKLEARSTDGPRGTRTKPT